MKNSKQFSSDRPGGGNGEQKILSAMEQLKAVMPKMINAENRQQVAIYNAYHLLKEYAAQVAASAPSQGSDKLQSVNPNLPNYIAVEPKSGTISDEWLRLWNEIQAWYGDIGKRETAEELISRLSAVLSLTFKQPKASAEPDDFVDKHLAVIRGLTESFKSGSLWFILSRVFPEFPDWKLRLMAKAAGAKPDESIYETFGLEPKASASAPLGGIGDQDRLQAIRDFFAFNWNDPEKVLLDHRFDHYQRYLATLPKGEVEQKEEPSQTAN